MPPGPRHILGVTLLLVIAAHAPQAIAQAPLAPKVHDDPPSSESPFGGTFRLGSFEQTRHWAAMPSWNEPEFGHDGPMNTSMLLNPHPLPVSGPGADPLLPDPLEYPLRPIRNIMEMLYEDNIQVTMDDVLVFQNVSRTIGEAEHNSLFNRFDIGAHVLTWTLPGHGHGIFTGLIRFNDNILGTATPGDAVGSFSPLDDLANDTTFLINRLEFQQELFDKRASLTIGKANPNDVIASNLFAWDETYQFMSVTFDGGNYPAGYGGYMPMIAFQAIPVDGIFISTALTSPPGSAIDIGSSLGNGLYWCAGEIGFVIEAGSEKRQGSYSIALMNSNAGPESDGRETSVSGSAMALVAQQELLDDVVLWSQYLLSSEEIGPAEQEFTIGLSIESCFGRKSDGFGVAVGWSRPSEPYFPGWRENLQLETYYRLQLTHTWQLSPDFQVVRPADPQAEDKPVLSFALRLKTTF